MGFVTFYEWQNNKHYRLTGGHRTRMLSDVDNVLKGPPFHDCSLKV